MIDGSAGTPATAMTPSISSEAMTMARMPTPDTGLFDEPIRPAMYPQMAATAKPISTT